MSSLSGASHTRRIRLNVRPSSNSFLQNIAPDATRVDESTFGSNRRKSYSGYKHDPAVPIFCFCALTCDPFYHTSVSCSYLLESLSYSKHDVDEVKQGSLLPCNHCRRLLSSTEEIPTLAQLREASKKRKIAHHMLYHRERRGQKKREYRVVATASPRGFLAERDPWYHTQIPCAASLKLAYREVDLDLEVVGSKFPCRGCRYEVLAWEKLPTPSEIKEAVRERQNARRWTNKQDLS